MKRRRRRRGGGRIEGERGVRRPKCKATDPIQTLAGRWVGGYWVVGTHWVVREREEIGCPLGIAQRAILRGSRETVSSTPSGFMVVRQPKALVGRWVGGWS